MDMSPAYKKGAAQYLPQEEIQQKHIFLMGLQRGPYLVPKSSVGLASLG